ncbi:MAG: hypothetical protein ACXABD_21980 [Candidatus Thorarchaeota archaeon]|jgi:hypothetical protein
MSERKGNMDSFDVWNPPNIVSQMQIDYGMREVLLFLDRDALKQFLAGERGRPCIELHVGKDFAKRRCERKARKRPFTYSTFDRWKIDQFSKERLGIPQGKKRFSELFLGQPPKRGKVAGWIFRFVLAFNILLNRRARQS